MITPINQNKTPFVTPGTEKPDLANGPFLSLTGENGVIAYIQMTNDRALWIKQVGAEDNFISTATFHASCCESIIDYLVQRQKETKL